MGVDVVPLMKLFSQLRNVKKKNYDLFSVKIFHSVSVLVLHMIQRLYMALLGCFYVVNVLVDLISAHLVSASFAIHVHIHTMHTEN